MYAACAQLAASGVELPRQELVKQHPQRVDVTPRVDIDRAISACSGLMYSGVPTTVPNCVNNVFSVSRWSIALATPKSITLGTGLPSWTVTSTFEGLMSRWMMPF